MKVLVISHIDNLSGANKSMFSIINELDNKISFTLLSNGKSDKMKNEINSKEVELIYTSYGWWYAKPRENLLKGVYRFTVDAFNYYSKKRIDKKLIQRLKNEKFDLIYTNTSTIDIGFKLSKILNIPHVWHIREFGKEDFGFIPVVSKKYIYQSLNKSESVITISNALKNKYKNIVEEEKLHLIYNGFDIEQLTFKPKNHNLKEKINILISGQVCEAKGQKEAIEAVKILNDSGYNIKLFIAGDINKYYLNSILSKYGEVHWIKILGKVKDMYELRNKMDIELVCSRSEAFGRVTIEAMLHGLPVVGSDSGGTSELIINGVTGMLYEPRNVEDLANKIKNIIDDVNLYNKISISAFNFAKKFTILNTADQIHNIFKKVVRDFGGLNG